MSELYCYRPKKVEVYRYTGDKNDLDSFVAWTKTLPHKFCDLYDDDKNLIMSNVDFICERMLDNHPFPYGNQFLIEYLKTGKPLVYDMILGYQGYRAWKLYIGSEFDLMFQSFKPETLPKDFSDLNNYAYKIYIQNQDCWLKQCGSALKKTFYATSYEQGTLFHSRWEAMDFIEKNHLSERYDIVPGYYTREGKLVLDP